MKVQKQKQCSPHGDGIVILEIPLAQFLVAEEGSLSEEEKKFIEELAREIEEDGLRSLPEVIYAHTEGGKHYYRFGKGKKRWYAHRLLKREFLICIVVPASEIDGRECGPP